MFCGYYYDEETGFYYLQTRYYDPAICRFINADTFATTDITGLLSANMFSYCENNPVMGSDPTGEWVHLLVGAFVGAVAGVVEQAVSDVINNKLSFSNLQTYVGAAVGGAVGGAVFAATANSAAAGAASGFAATFTSEALQKSETKKTWYNIAEESALNAASGAFTGKLGSRIKLGGITSGRNSWSAVYKSGLTKLKHGTAKKMSVRVMGKGVGSTIVGDVFTILSPNCSNRIF